MNGNWKNTVRKTLKALLWVAGAWIAILVILEVVLSQSVLTGLVNKYASEYIDGDLRFGKVSASMFRRFPSVTLTLDDFSITYPADRFDEKETMGIQGRLMYQGCGEEKDTLASFRRFSAAVNLPALLGGTINIPYLRLDKPRIFAHSYHDGSKNWDIFITENEEEVQDTAETDGKMPKIVLGRIRMTEHPHIVYTDSRDTIFALVNINKVNFNGRINMRQTSRSKVGLTLDSMLVAGRIGRDTISMGLERLYMHERDKHIDVDAAAKAFMASRAFGRMMVPVDIKGTLSLLRDTIPAVKAENFRINAAYIPVTADAELRFRQNQTYIKADIGIEECPIGELLDKYADNFIPALDGFSTDAKISMSVRCDGEYDHISGKLPQMRANITIPDSGISHESIPGQAVKVGLDVDGQVGTDGKVNVSVKKLEADAKGVKLAVEGDLKDIMGNDPDITIDAGLHADIDTLSGFVPDSLKINASGKLEAYARGSAKLSQLNIHNFSSSSLTGEIIGKGIDISMPDDTIAAVIDGLKITLGPEEKTSRMGNGRSMKLMGITGAIEKAEISYKDAISVNTSEFRIAAKNAVSDNSHEKDTTRRIYPFGGSISAGKLTLKDSEGSVISLDSTWNGFQILPKKGQAKVPVLTLNSRNNKVLIKSDVNRAIISKADISANAVLNTVERRQKMKAFRDSLARVYPDIPKDSLFSHLMAQKGPRKQLPDWLKEEDFRKQDIDISLDKTLAKYFRDWDISGKINVGSGAVMTPYFPLRNILNGFDFKFDNDKIAIERLNIVSGKSDIGVTGELTGLRKALLGRKGVLKLKADINSSGMDANQLLSAYTKGSTFNPEGFSAKEDISDEEFLEDIIIDSTEITDLPSLIVIPANVNADINLTASDIKYSQLRISKMTADILMKERCIQITNTLAESNMGQISMEGFYGTRSKKDLKTGFSLNFKDITAEKVIGLMPSIDTIMPLLKSFGGKLNCELAATSQIDTNMNIIMPSIDGVMRISGENLTIKDSDLFKSMAKLLMFKNKNEGRIDRMTVEGVIHDSKVEIFPFILEMDRYTLGLSGIQNMDMSFRYHASLIKSPFLIKVGVDLYGPDFDNMKFKIGKAKYKTTDVPAFTTVIDETKVNLVKSIRNIFDKGIDAAINENSGSDAVEKHKKKIGYVQAIDQKMEELSEDEQKTLEEQNNEQSGIHRDGSENNSVQ